MMWLKSTSIDNSLLLCFELFICDLKLGIMILIKIWKHDKAVIFITFKHWCGYTLSKLMRNSFIPFLKFLLYLLSCFFHFFIFITMEMSHAFYHDIIIQNRYNSDRYSLGIFTPVVYMQRFSMCKWVWFSLTIYTTLIIHWMQSRPNIGLILPSSSSVSVSSKK